MLIPEGSGTDNPIAQHAILIGSGSAGPLGPSIIPPPCNFRSIREVDLNTAYRLNQLWVVQESKRRKKQTQPPPIMSHYSLRK